MWLAKKPRVCNLFSEVTVEGAIGLALLVVGKACPSESAEVTRHPCPCQQ